MSIAVESLSREQLLQMQSSARAFQQRADDCLAPWDLRARGPILGEDVAKYRRDLAVQLKRQLPEGHELRKVQYRRLNDSALAALEPQLYSAVHRAAYDASSVPPGEFRRVVEVDQGGTKIVRWIGQESFVRQMGREGRRVVSFRTDQGFIDASGRALR